jgi:hypothetical protein
VGATRRAGSMSANDEAVIRGGVQSFARSLDLFETVVREEFAADSSVLT